MITYLSQLRINANLSEGWLMLYRRSWDDDDVMHPEVLMDMEM